MNVLYVDDDAALTDLLREVIEEQHEDITIQTAADAKEALAILESDTDVDCVVSDYEMPEVNGLELLETVRKRWPDLPFILFTGRGTEAIAAQAINAGVTDYVQKRPDMVQFLTLINRVRKVVTHRRITAELVRELRLEREHFKLALEKSPFVAFRLDTDLRYTWIGNPHSDFAEVDVLGKRDDELLPAAAAEVIMAPKRRALETGERVREEVTFELPSGEVTYDLTVQPFRDESGEVVGLTCASLDITDRKEYERSLERDTHRSDAQLELLVDSVEGAAIFFLDTDGNIRSWNRGAEKITGYPSEEVLGEHFSLFYREEDIEAGVPDRNLREATERGRLVDKGWRVRRDGSMFWADVELTALRDGDELLGYAKVTRDNSQQKRERDLLNQKELLENLIATISHDLRNPLLVVGGYVRMARETGDLSKLETAEQALERATELLDYLRNVAEEGEYSIDPEPVGLREVAEAAWSVTVTDGASLDVEDDQTVVADRWLVQQLLENLFGNAVKHAGPDVTVAVGTLPGGFYVEDDGPGIPPEERETVFERGFSTDPDGSGVGLAICNRIADAHGWAIAVADGPDGGARFEVTNVDTRSVQRPIADSEEASKE